MTYDIANCTEHDLYNERSRIIQEASRYSTRALSDEKYRGHLEALKHREARIGRELNRRIGMPKNGAKERKVIIEGFEYTATFSKPEGYGARYAAAKVPTFWIVEYQNRLRRINLDARSCTKAEIENDQGAGAIGQSYINVNGVSVRVKFK